MQPFIEIQCATHVYPVFACATMEEAVLQGSDKGSLCIVDREVLRSYQPVFVDLVWENRICVVEASESAKSYQEVGTVIDWLLRHGVRRNQTLLVVGGGTLQDIGCYAASILMRGLKWTLISTTLLGQCDSCIGSKSSINLGTFKNQVGTFWAPGQVILPAAALDTLPWDEIRSGIGEAIKLHLLAGEREFMWLLPKLALLSAESREGIGEIVHSSLKIKKTYIEQDEFDKGVRNLLNYGHTFAHAYESVTSYAIPHGIAVTLGILTATYISARRGLIDQSAVEMLVTHLQPWYSGFQQHLLPMSGTTILEAMKRDKKATGSSIVCILTRGAGAMERVQIDDLDDLSAGVDGFIDMLRIAHGEVR